MAATTIDKTRARPRLARDLRPSDIRCEAGDTARCGRAVFCKVAREIVDADFNPSSVMNFCAGDPSQCPTLRAAKDAERADRLRYFDKEIRRSAGALR